MIDDHYVRPEFLDPIRDLLKHPLDMLGVVTDECASDHRCPMPVVEIDLGSGDVELPMQASQQRFKPTSLLLQRAASREVQLNRQCSDVHGPSLVRLNTRDKEPPGVYNAGMNKNPLTWILVAIAAVVLIFSLVLVQEVRRVAEPVSELREQLNTQFDRLFNPTPTIRPDPVSIVHEVRTLARLETIQYAVEKVITAETGQEFLGFLFGDRLLLVAHGTVIAGVDLDKIGVDDIEIDADGRVLLNLPPAQVFATVLDNEKSYIYDRDVGLLRRGDVQLESAARLAAEREIERTALEDGILDQAQVNAEAYLYRLLRSLGFPDVTIQWQTQ